MWGSGWGPGSWQMNQENFMVPQDSGRKGRKEPVTWTFSCKINCLWNAHEVRSKFKVLCGNVNIFSTFPPSSMSPHGVNNLYILSKCDVFFIVRHFSLYFFLPVGKLKPKRKTINLSVAFLSFSEVADTGIHFKPPGNNSSLTGFTTKTWTFFLTISIFFLLFIYWFFLNFYQCFFFSCANSWVFEVQFQQVVDEYVEFCVWKGCKCVILWCG